MQELAQVVAVHDDVQHWPVDWGLVVDHVCCGEKWRPGILEHMFPILVDEVGAVVVGLFVVIIK
jgi:hypothetical protein